MAILKDGKTENLTIRVEPDFRKRVEAVRQEYFPRIPMNVFLEMMIEVGMEVEEQFAVLKKELFTEMVKNKYDILVSHQENTSKIGNPQRKTLIKGD
ncbi:hypothetical protein AGMMS49991_04120 [Spirochaetia bacterium]|nr:hypothetical protein AGMMS49991_04120 [Spirochaetia bacterium]